MFISPGTKSAVFGASGYSTGQISTTVACTNTCQATLSVVPETLGFSVVLYGSPGQELGAGQISATIVEAQNNSVIIPVMANIVNCALQASSLSVHASQASTITISALGFDPSGATVTGTIPYLLPITFTIAGSAASAFSATATTLASPTSAVSLNYNGLAAAGQSAILIPNIAQPFPLNLMSLTINVVP